MAAGGALAGGSCMGHRGGVTVFWWCPQCSHLSVGRVPRLSAPAGPFSVVMGLTSLHGRTPPACKFGEVPWTSPMQEGADSESSPRNAHVVQGLGRAPFLEGLLADREQRRTTTLTLGAHEICTPSSGLRRRSGHTGRPL